ncbi:MAG: hypothetical protein K9K67_00345 [Bacteriovoracaceae bacterium]|nr:hypothetical protein [Bacteriovoracaceae bacterium]
MDNLIPFEIIRIDPMGQGVSLLQDKVTFIPKAIPGDKGLAEVIETKGKKVQFAKIQKITEPSELRIESSCPHYSECQGCSFLNMSYELEGQSKLAAYSFLFKDLVATKDIDYQAAKERFNYRNRIQLSYDLLDSSIGLKTRLGILEIPHCKIPKTPIQEELQKIYADENYWQQLLPKNAPEEGHIELYLINDQLKVTANKPYSEGGFSQVHQEMADFAKAQISSYLETESPTIATVELFGGKGYLSDEHQGPRLICDQGLDIQDIGKTKFLDMNLFDKFAPEKVNKALGKLESVHGPESWQMIIDPPRSGLKNIKKFFTQEYMAKKVTTIAYLSCNPQTQIRDVSNLLETKKWAIKKVSFFDFFPATHHLESLVILERL